MIQRESHGEISILRLAHGKASALDLEFLEALVTELAGEARSSTRALVLTGRGSIFSAGVDLLRVLAEGARYVERLLPALDLALERLFTLDKPVVAAVNGHALAGGAILAAACDRRILARGRATFGAPELKVGVPFPPLPLELYRRICPPGRASELALGGRVVGTDEALALGLVDELVEPGALLERALEIARELAAMPPSAFALTKRMLHAPSLEHAARQQQELGGALLDAWRSDEVREAMRGYVERTLKK